MVDYKKKYLKYKKKYLEQKKLIGGSEYRDLDYPEPDLKPLPELDQDEMDILAEKLGKMPTKVTPDIVKLVKAMKNMRIETKESKEPNCTIS